VKIGFVVNPIAGMGGPVALKGTDGDAIRKEAERRGAVRTAPQKAVRALLAMNKAGIRGEFYTCLGPMGHDELAEAGYKGTVVHEPGKATTSGDTKKAASEFVERGVDLIVFVGGDGTARDIVEVVGKRVPVIGIPAGVKMHSGVFVFTAEEIAGLVRSYEEAGQTKDVEVLDVDEESYRGGLLRTKLFGIAKVPDSPEHIQSGKMTYHSGSADNEAEEIGQYMAEGMEQGILYLIGPGSTTARIADALGQEKTVLGVDAYLNGELVQADLTDLDIVRLVQRHRRARLVLSPIGAQGFVLGRGNQQFSPKVIRLVGAENIVVIATPSKLKNTNKLRVDTGDPELDESLRGPTRVVTGYKRRRLLQIL
jgi:predicted polyphosphate/ATP-dependent NAD kinase